MRVSVSNVIVLYDIGVMIATIERSTHMIATYLERALPGLPVTQAEAHVLAQLERHGPTPLGELHREFGHKRSTLTSVIDRLENRAWVRREINLADRRSFVIRLTRRGRAPARAVTAALDQLEAEVRGAVSPRDLHGLEAVSGALAEAVGALTPR
jgi:DNA-binding MarR family transcriptional regulator